MSGTVTGGVVQRRLHGAAVRACAILALVALAPAARASDLAVRKVAASEGTWGLVVETEIGCAQADLLIPAGPVTGDQVSCSTITTATPGPVNVASPGADFLTGGQITLNSGFSVDPNELLSARNNAFIATPFAYVTDGSPASLPRYVAWFSLDLDPFSLALGEDIGVLVGYDGGGVPQFRVLVRRNAAPAENRLVIQGRDNTLGGLVEHGEEFPLVAGHNRVSVWWRALDDRGQLLVSVNHTPLVWLEDLDNASSRIDSVRFGLVDGAPVSTTGSIYLDDFSSFRTLAP